LDATRKDDGGSEEGDESWNTRTPQLGLRGQENGCNVDGAHGAQKEGHSFRSRTKRQYLHKDPFL
jgi:hypothetical protein